MSTDNARFFIPKSLDSPILITPFRAAQRVSLRPAANPTSHTEKEVLQVTTAAEELFGSSFSVERTLTPEMYPSVFASYSQDLNRSFKELAKAEQAIQPMVDATEKAISDYAGVQYPRGTFVFRSLESDKYYGRSRYWEILVEKLDEHKVNGGRGPLALPALGWILSPSLCYCSHLRAATGGTFLTYEQLLMVKDAMTSRYQTLIAANLFYGANNVVSELAAGLWRWQELMLLDYGNEGYELVKSTESLAKAYLSRLSGDLLAGPDDSYARMRQKVDDKEVKILAKRGLTLSGPSASSLYHATVLSQTKDLQTCTELFGLQKMSGHPLIDPLVGGLSAASEARSPDRTRIEDAQELRNTLCRLFCETHIRKKGSWPKLNFGDKTTVLFELYSRGVLHLNRQSYPLSDWDQVSYVKMLDFEYYDNFLDIMDDKAISLYADEKHMTWDGGKPRSDKRLLLEVLKRESLSIRDIFETVETENIPWWWKIVSLYPKEREFKLAARMFSMMVLEIRAFFAVHEANLAEQILEYFPQLTMVDDKLKVHERFLRMTGPVNVRETLRLLLELDLSRWNLRWRELTVHKVGGDLNDLFGLKHVYTTVHKFFAEATVMVRCAGLRPDQVEEDYPPESDLLWYGHLGGFEGIAQKLWSICTVGMIEKAVADLDIHYELTIQGDNVVMAVGVDRDPTRAPRDQLVALEQEILKRCSASADSVNQELKPEECLSSTSVITYSKAVYIDGVDYPTTLKSCSRLFPSSAVDFPSIGSYLQSFFAGAYAAAENSREPIRCYYLSLFHSALYLVNLKDSEGPYRQSVESLDHLSTMDGIRTFLTCPSELGGASIIGPYAFLYKGGGDPLSKSLASLKLTQGHWPPARWWIHRASSPDWFSRNPDLSALLQDPFGLPVSKPVNPADAVASRTLEVLRDGVRNRDIGQVLRFSDEEYRLQLLELIRTLKPFNPVVARDLYDCSVFGTVDSISRMFLKTRSLQGLSRNIPGIGIVSTMLIAGGRELNYFDALASPYRLVDTHLTNLFSWVEYLRGFWKPTGVTVTDITSWLPIDCDISFSPSPTTNEIRVAASYSDGTDPFWSRGPEKAYLGTRTVEKRSDHGYRIYGKTRAASALKSLARILAWSESDPGMDRLIDHLSVTRSGHPLTDYRTILPAVLGGSAGHRYEARIGDRDAHILGLSTFASWCGFDSDYAGFLSASLEDYPVMFQEYYLTGISLLALRKQLHPSLKRDELAFIIGKDPIPALTGDSLRVEGVVFGLPVPEDLGPLVTDHGITLKRISRPEIGGYPVQGISSPAVVRYAGLVVQMASQLRGLGGVVGTIDNVGSRRGGKLGVAEALGAGLPTLVSAASLAVLQTVSGVIFSPSLSKRFNANVDFLVRRFGRVLAASILPLCQHPQMRPDRLVQELGLVRGLSYDGSSPVARLTHAIGRSVNRMLEDSRSPFYTRPLVVFPDEGESAVYYAIINDLRRRLSLLVLQDEIAPWEAECLVGSVIAHSKKNYMSTEQQIHAARAHMLTAPTLRFDKAGLSLATSAQAKLVAEGNFDRPILLSSASADESVRMYRGASLMSVCPAPHLADYLNEEWSHFSPPQAVEPSTVVSDSFRCLTFVEQIERKIQRAMGRPVSFGTGAYSTWGRIRSYVTCELALVVGSGHGGAALAAFKGQVQFVHGVDLLTDLPTGPSAARHVPTLIAHEGLSGRYTQFVPPKDTVGDWWDIRVSSRLLRYSDEPYLLMIDIPSERGYTWEVLRPLMRSGFEHRLMLRVQAPEESHRPVLWYLNTYGSVQAVMCAETVMDVSDRIYVVDHLKPGRAPRQGLSLVGEWNPPFPLERMTVSSIIGDLFSRVGVCSGRTVEEVLDGTLDLVTDLQHSGESRPGYSEWTSLLEAVFCVRWIREEDPILRSSLTLDAILQRPLELELGHGTKTWYTPDSGRMSRYLPLAARLVGHLSYVLD